MRNALLTILTISVLALAASVNAQSFKDGHKAYKAGEYLTAFEICLPFADKGNADAQFRIGTMYTNGFGFPQNDIEAGLWWRMVAEQGDVLAQNKPIYKTACENDGIIPTSELNIFDKRQELKDFGWRPVTSSPKSEQFKDSYELDPFYDTVRVEDDLPELVTCGGMYCKFLYETEKSYLDITTIGEDYWVVSYDAFCK